MYVRIYVCMYVRMQVCTCTYVYVQPARHQGVEEIWAVWCGLDAEIRSRRKWAWNLLRTRVALALCVGQSPGAAKGDKHSKSVESLSLQDKWESTRARSCSLHVSALFVPSFSFRSPVFTMLICSPPTCLTTFRLPIGSSKRYSLQHRMTRACKFTRTNTNKHFNR